MLVARRLSRTKKDLISEEFTITKFYKFLKSIKTQPQVAASDTSIKLNYSLSFSAAELSASSEVSGSSSLGG